jgi:hypothetical protein
MNPAQPVENEAGRGRRTLSDVAVMIVWAAGFFGTVQAEDGVSMAISLSLMMLSAIYLGYRGRLGRRTDRRRPRMCVQTLFRTAVFVIMGPLVAAFLKLMVKMGFGQGYEDVVSILILTGVLVFVDRLIAGRH